MPVPERAGRARPFVVVAPILAIVLLVVAIVIAVGGPAPFEPNPTVRPSATAIPASMSDLPSPSMALAAPLGCATMAPPSPDADEVLVYFDCGGPPNDPRPVLRSVEAGSPTAARLRTAIGALLDGPTSAERALGYAGFLAAGSREALLAVEVVDRSAVIDFSDALTRGALSASHNRFIVFGTLGATIRQFEEIESVELRIKGSCEAFGAFFESACTLVRGRTGISGDWLLVTAVVDGVRIETSAAGPVTIVIEADALRGQAQCNVFGAPLQVNGQRVELGAIEASEVECPANIMAAEASYLRALERVTTARADGGQLLLTDRRSSCDTRSSARSCRAVRRPSLRASG